MVREPSAYADATANKQGGISYHDKRNFKKCMFDDPKFQKQQPAKFVGPSEKSPNVEDIFDKTADQPSAPQAAAPVMPAVPQQMPAAPAPIGKAPMPAPVAGKKGVFIVAAVLVVIAGLGAAGWFVYDMISTGKSISDGIGQIPSPQKEETKQEAQPVVPEAAVEQTPAEEPAAVDSDSDGLLDTEEATYGTNPAKADSDDDGLTDKEEVKIYQTDPLSPDTDGDGFDDGTEIKSGYNPNGQGKLLDFEKAKKALQGVE